MKRTRHMKTARIILGLIWLVWAVGTIGQLGTAQPTTYGGVTFPQGDSAFADRVAAYVQGSCVCTAFSRAKEALGPPDCDGPGCTNCAGCGTCSVSLGYRLSELDDRAYLVLEFVDNRLVDVPGPDLFVYITNGHPARIEISADGSSFIAVGQADSWPTGIDISPYVQPGEEFRFVRISDVPADEDRSACSGPCVDAVGAMGPTRATGEEMGALELRPGGELALTALEAPKNLLIILDTSSSMAEPFEDSTKIEVAKRVLDELVGTIPDGTRVGLRVFGGCQVSKLLVPLAPLDRAALRARIQAIETGGPTPIAYALEQAKEDFDGAYGPDLILLVTDGMETCHGDPVKAAKDLLAAGYDLKIHVVGFDIGSLPKAREQLKEIAAATGGIYFDAQSSSELRQALQLPTELRYHVYDQAGQEVFSGNLREPAPNLPAGVYRVVIDTLPPTVVENVIVSANKTTMITVERADGGYKAEVSTP